MIRTALLLSALLALLAFPARADHKHKLLRRVAVFPIHQEGVANAEEAWWQMREQLTKDQRFLVASRRFMINRGVFQPRKEFKPADAIILAKILDAQALVVSSIQERRFHLKAYDGENGFLLWEGTMEFHPALSMSDQIVAAAQKMIHDFISDIPYQGFVIIDPLKGHALFEEGGQRRAWVYHGMSKNIDVGDPVEVIEFSGETSRPYFANGRAMVVAQGTVVEVQTDRSLVQVEKLRQLEDIKEFALVRFPKEVKRLTEMYSQGAGASALTPEYLSSELKPAGAVDKRHSTTATSLAFIFNLAAMILLAF